MRILVYGAGNIGSIYAGLLAHAGHDLTVLARGARLDRIRANGIELESLTDGRRTSARPVVVDRLQPDDAFDFVLVTLGRQHLSDVLPVLARNRHTPAVLFLCNNASGPEELIDALGDSRVLLGFPGAAGVPRGDTIRYVIMSAQEQPTTIGEPDGSRSARIERLADVLRSAGFSVAICEQMDAWLKTHVAEISPSANALYMAAGDPQRLARTRDALVLMIRAIREGFRVLRARGIPVTPRSHRVFRWLPEPLLVAIMRRKLPSEAWSIKLGHALDARDEMARLTADFAVIASQTSTPTPSMQRLARHIDPDVDAMADGSAALPMRWLWP